MGSHGRSHHLCMQDYHLVEIVSMQLENQYFSSGVKRRKVNDAMHHQKKMKLIKRRMAINKVAWKRMLIRKLDGNFPYKEMNHHPPLNFISLNIVKDILFYLNFMGKLPLTPMNYRALVICLHELPSVILDPIKFPNLSQQPSILQNNISIPKIPSKVNCDNLTPLAFLGIKRTNASNCHNLKVLGD